MSNNLIALAGFADHASLPVQLLLVFATAKLLAEGFERAGIPGIIGEIAAGAVLGPSVLNLVHPTEVLTTLSDLGAMFLLFRVGLEVKSAELFRVGLPATFVASLGVAVPFASGWVVSSWWQMPRIESIFIAAAMVATSVGITAQVLAARGLLQVRASQIILAAAIIDDVLGLLVLAVVSSVAHGELDIIELGITAVVAVAFVVIVALWGTRAVKVIAPRVQNLKVAEGQFALALCLLFGLAAVAVYAGVAAIIGAFLAGMALSEHVGTRVHDLTNGVTELLVPFFLAGIGLHLNLVVFTAGPQLAFSIVIVIVAIVSKLAGCGLAALRFGRADMIRIGVGMIPRGEVGMVVAQLGLSMAVMSENAFAAVVFMSVMTTLVAPPLLTWAYRGIAPGRETEEFRIG